VPTGLAAILVLTAVELETRALARALSLPTRPSLPFLAFRSDRVCIAPIGLGASRLKERWPVLVADAERPLVVSAGVCGALDPALAVGDLVLADSVIDGSGMRHAVTAGVQRAAVAARTRGRGGAMVSVRQALATPESKAALRAETGAAAVDMESAAIVAAAAEHACPSLIVRGVSDDARETLPAELLTLLTDDGRLRSSRLLALAQPGLLRAALRLRRGSREALARVANALALLAA
jgi:adenosylhomocysteine nucleosidase